MKRDREDEPMADMKKMVADYIDSLEADMKQMVPEKKARNEAEHKESADVTSHAPATPKVQAKRTEPTQEPVAQSSLDYLDSLDFWS